MADVIFITGGQRSGKSRYAQLIAEGKSANPLYLATARAWDDDFEKRIKRHQADRGENWTTLEEQMYLGNHRLSGRVVVLDCVTLWLNNVFFENGFDVDKSLEFAKNEWYKFIHHHFTLIAVSNELGMGIHSENEASRKFADLQGWMNQYIAENAHQVVLMVSGIPVSIKG